VSGVSKDCTPTATTAHTQKHMKSCTLGSHGHRELARAAISTETTLSERIGLVRHIQLDFECSQPVREVYKGSVHDWQLIGARTPSFIVL
jgi:hypothetical protein